MPAQYMIVVDKLTNKLIDSSKLQFVDKLERLRMAGKHWEAIDAIVDYWISRNPRKYKSFVIEIDQKRKTRLNKHGSNTAKSMRSLVDMPEDVYYLIRKLYNTEELEIDKEFMHTFYKRYPVFRVSETL